MKLVEATLQQLLVAEKPLRLIADKAYDSDPLREALLDQETLLLAPHRKGRTKPSFNDGRWLRRYRKRVPHVLRSAQIRTGPATPVRET